MSFTLSPLPLYLPYFIQQTQNNYLFDFTFSSLTDVATFSFPFRSCFSMFALIRDQHSKCMAGFLLCSATLPFRFGAEIGCSFQFKLGRFFSLSQFAYFNPNKVFHANCERAQSTMYKIIQMNARSVFNFWSLCTTKC